MKTVIQRVMKCDVEINNSIHSSINYGLVILLGISDTDSEMDAHHLCNKIKDLRIFDDENHKMNLSQAEVNAELMVVSQFTLYADTHKGNRPSYIRAARPEKAMPLYEYFVQHLSTVTGKNVATGVFGADMQIHLVNDGPVTILLESVSS